MEVKPITQGYVKGSLSQRGGGQTHYTRLRQGLPITEGWRSNPLHKATSRAPYHRRVEVKPITQGYVKGSLSQRGGGQTHYTRLRQGLPITDGWRSNPLHKATSRAPYHRGVEVKPITQGYVKGSLSQTGGGQTHYTRLRQGLPITDGWRSNPLHKATSRAPYHRRVEVKPITQGYVKGSLSQRGGGQTHYTRLRQGLPITEGWMSNPLHKATSRAPHHRRVEVKPITQGYVKGSPSQTGGGQTHYTRLRQGLPITDGWRSNPLHKATSRAPYHRGVEVKPITQGYVKGSPSQRGGGQTHYTRLSQGLPITEGWRSNPLHKATSRAPYHRGVEVKPITQGYVKGSPSQRGGGQTHYTRLSQGLSLPIASVNADP